MTGKKRPSIALVHDYLREYGGAERVLEELHALFPDAPVYTAFVDKHTLGLHWKKFENWMIIESWASKIPFIKTAYSPLRVISGMFFSRFDFSNYDVVISSTNMYMAKAIKTTPPTKHYCYCHTPPRSLYGYTTMTDWKKNIIIRIGGEVINHFLRIVDYETAQNPDVIIANSKEVQRRIRKFYRRESVVIHPPVDVPASLPRVQKKGYMLYVGRIGVSKHANLVVETCAKLGKKLYVVGTGKNMEYFKSLGGETVEFLGSVSDDDLHRLYAEAKMLIYPAEDEDFGMIPIEAMGYGTPVIVHKSGGFLETVRDGKDGVFIEEFTVDALSQAIARVEKMSWSANTLHAQAKKYAKSVFDQKILKLISE